VVVVGGRHAAALLAAEEEAGEEDVPHRGRWAARRGGSERLRGGVGDVVEAVAVGGGRWRVDGAGSGHRSRSRWAAL
jgi:hypothetical protein